MTITISSTPTIVTLDGMPVRVWNGITEHGGACVVFVHRIALPPDHEALAVEAKLMAQPPPQTMEPCGFDPDAWDDIPF